MLILPQFSRDLTYIARGRGVLGAKSHTISIYNTPPTCIYTTSHHPQPAYIPPHTTPNSINFDRFCTIFDNYSN